MRYKLAIVSYKVQFWGEKKTDMLSELRVYNSQFWLNNSRLYQNCEIKSHNYLFFFFYSVAETGLHRRQTIYNLFHSILFHLSEDLGAVTARIWKRPNVRLLICLAKYIIYHKYLRIWFWLDTVYETGIRTVLCFELFSRCFGHISLSGCFKTLEMLKCIDF